MPTGSKDPDVLLDWILNSMGLVRRKKDVDGEQFRNSAIHRIMREVLLTDPLRGWDSKEIGDLTGISNTGIHHQLVKLRSCGLVAKQVEGKWHRYVLRGGSMSAAVGLAKSQAMAVLEMRLKELSVLVQKSEARMSTESEDSEIPFYLRISECGPMKEGFDKTSSMVADFGLAGENFLSGRDLATSIVGELCSSQNPITAMVLSESLSASRGRVATVIDRMRAGGFVERVPMISRLSQDIFSGIVRQLDARGEGWLMTRGGLGRLEASVSDTLVTESRKGLTIEKVSEILSPVSIRDQRILLNTLGGRMPYGIRIAGADGAAVLQRVSRKADRTLRRISTVSERMDAILSTQS